MQGGNLTGTFTTSQTVNGDGTADSGTYTLTDASVYSSTYPDIEVGSISDGTYAFGSQPDYRFRWDGASVTEFSRMNEAYTNGFGIDNGQGGSGATLGFGISYQRAATSIYGTEIFQSSVTPSLTPVGASGLCPGQDSSPPGGGSTGVDESAPVARVALTLTGFPGSVSSVTPGTWLTLPTGEELARTQGRTGPGGTLLGWATTPDFPIDVASRQVEHGWGAYDGEIGGIRMIFIPSSQATLVSGATTLFPVWSA